MVRWHGGPRMLGIETQMVLPAVLGARWRQMSRYNDWH
jgi:hypothetical protein